jgi:putative phosphoesterase
MRIGLISDTHIRETSQNLPSKVIKTFQDVDLILHAGDIYNPSVLDELELLAPVFAAVGDDDYGEILTDRRVKDKQVFHFKEKVLWLVHHSSHYYLCKSRKGMENTDPHLPDMPDIVVFGHAHYTILETHCGILFINPGSAIAVENSLVPGTVAILTIESGDQKVHILPL